MHGLLNSMRGMKDKQKLGILNYILSNPETLEGLAPRMNPQNADVQATPGADSSFYTGEAPTQPNPFELALQSVMPEGNYASKSIPRVPRDMFDGRQSLPTIF